MLHSGDRLQQLVRFDQAVRLNVFDDLVVKRADLIFQKRHMVQRQVDQLPVQIIHPVVFQRCADLWDFLLRPLLRQRRNFRWVRLAF